MRLLLLADQRVGLEIAKYILGCHPEDLAAVVTTGDNDIYCLAQQHGVPAYICGNAGESISDRLVGGSFDVGVLAWWPWIINEALIELPRKGFINTHPSLLPHARGKHPNFWSIVEEAPFGTSLHKVALKVDSGDIVAQQPIPYGWCDTGGSIYTKALVATVDLFKATYPAIRTGEFPLVPQRLTSGSFHLSSEIADASRIDLDKSYRGRDLLNMLRARTFPGYPGCWFEDSGVRYEVTVSIRSLNDE